MPQLLEAGYEAPERTLPLEVVKRKGGLSPIVLEISHDEWCLQLGEQNMTSQVPGEGVRRYLIVWVIRNDRPARFQKDLGPAKDFVGDELLIPGGFSDEATREYVIVHKVGELLDMAEEWRHTPSVVKKYTPRNWVLDLSIHEEGLKKAARGWKQYPAAKT